MRCLQGLGRGSPWFFGPAVLISFLNGEMIRGCQVVTFAFHNPKVTVLPAQFLTSWAKRLGSGLSYRASQQHLPEYAEARDSVQLAVH